jgi:type II restriction/modification system DNA methylase subunit YeeA
METAKLKKFAQFARRSLIEQISTKLKQVLADNSPARRENTKAISQLEKAVKEHGKEQVIERVAYTWFNRFCALRFMDVNRYTRIGVVSPAEGQFQPEILAEAKMGHIDENMVSDKVRQQVFSLLEGKSPSHDPQGEAYRLLLVAACNSWHRAMSFLFEQINDYTELLMPDDLLSGNSILAHIREAMTPDVCYQPSVVSRQPSVLSHQPSAISNQKKRAEGCGLKADGSAAGGGVEVIGWLYQFYISEKKDAVFAGLKKNKKITPENIPAATQLFTPHWIVRYLVENSLGRLWMLNHPNSRLIERMKYYIKPEQPETDFLRINKPEEIKFCDPACGSGHILAYAFDLFYAMYEEEGYEPGEIPGKILTHNLYGIEIDDRAGALAAFALSMKARTRHRRFFRKPVTPNICVLKNVQFDDKEINEYMDFIGWDLFTTPLQTTLRQFEEADNFGSLIRPDITDVAGLLKMLESKNIEDHMFLSLPHQKVLQTLRQADYLSPKYHVVVANPPYMGSKGMNGRLAVWARESYPNSKSDLFAMFIERNLDLTQKHGAVAMITMQSWMFLTYFEKLRATLLRRCMITSMCHLGPHAFDSIGGEVVQTTAFVMENNPKSVSKGSFLRLVDGDSEAEKKRLFFDRKSNPFEAATAKFISIAGNPIIYWVSDQVRNIFETKPALNDLASIKSGLSTGNNERFVRIWSEVNSKDIEFRHGTNIVCINRSYSWVPYNKGGESRRWFGNNNNVVFWKDNGAYLRNTGVFRNPSFYFREGITWSGMSSKNIAFRFVKSGFIFDSNKGPMVFQEDNAITNIVLLGLLNTPITSYILDALNPTVSTQVGDLERIPVSIPTSCNLSEEISSCISISRADWNSYETSWDFTSLPMLNPIHRQLTLKGTYQNIRIHWQEMTMEMQRLEEENNRIFIEAYGLQDELRPEVPLKEITLTCNPHYRYGGNKSEEELEALLMADTMRELISYAVGCMFGRYALDKPGLILANQGETLADFARKVGSGEWGVGRKAVESGKWVVGKEDPELSTTHYPLPTGANGESDNGNSKKLQTTDRLAKGNGFSGTGLSSDQAVSKRRTVRADESGSPVSGFHTIQHSGRAGQKVDGRVSEFLVDCERFKSRDGDPNPACPTLELCNERNSTKNSGTFGRSKPLAVRADEQPEITPHCPLSTIHCPLSTIHFLPDEDNVIPLLDADWFSDDITERFKQFLRITFGEEHYEENLTFIEQGLNIKGKRSYTIRDYFLGEFYSDHVRRYKRRPIYWLFSSPKGSFNALIYMHRYQPYTASTVLSYLRDFKNEKLRAHKNQLEAVNISADASKKEKTKAVKEIEKVNKIVTELETHERDILYPLATKQVEIDLDDGVKANYPKFGAALKKIPGLS